MGSVRADSRVVWLRWPAPIPSPNGECRLSLMERTKVVTIVIAAGYSLVRDGLVSLCASQANFEVLAQTSDGVGAVNAIEAFRPDIAILDLQLQGLDTLEVIRRIRASTSTRVSGNTRIVILRGLPTFRRVDFV